MSIRYDINNRGFTLIEMLTVIGIIAIVTAIAIPNYLEWRRDANLRRAVNDLTSDLAMARLHAIKSSNDVRVSFTATGYRVFIDDDDETVLREREYVGGVSMQYGRFWNSPSDETRFRNTGRASNGRVILTNKPDTFKTIWLSAVGRVRVE